MSKRGADTEKEKRRSMAERGVDAEEEEECERVRSYERKRFLFFSAISRSRAYSFCLGKESSYLDLFS